ncbi:MAG: hypothetical protein ABI488_19260 [Polyangiaceae bacterium]
MQHARASSFPPRDRALGTCTNPDHASKDFALGLDYESEFGRLFAGLPPAAKRAQLDR